MKRYMGILICLLAVVGVIFYVSGGIVVPESSVFNKDTIKANVAALANEETKALPEITEAETTAAPTTAAPTTEAPTTAAPTTEAPTTTAASSTADVSDLQAEQDKIIGMYKTVTFSNADLIKRFKDCVIVGDSMVQATYPYKWLNTTIAYGKIGVSIVSGADLIEEALATNPKKIFLVFGVNDIESYVSHVSLWIEKYQDALENIKTKAPNTTIYVVALFPPREGLVETKTFYQYLDEYNSALKKLCQEESVNFIDCGFILKRIPALYDNDGVHPISAFYPLWYTYLADVAGLPDYE